MAKKELVREFLALLNLDALTGDQTVRLGELAREPEVRETFGAKVAVQMAVAAMGPEPAETAASPSGLPFHQPNRLAALQVAATLTAGYWVATATGPDAPTFTQEDYLATFDAMAKAVGRAL